ncbi:hypothetical protein RQP46_002381 [Phenoliferia psychrophenolica]
MPRPKKSESASVMFLAGGTAGLVEGSLLYPLEFLKTQAQLGSSTPGWGRKAPSVFSLARNTVQQHGARGLYAGLGALLVGGVGKSGVRFLTYDRLKAGLVDKEGKLSGSTSLLAGLGAGIAEALVVVTPAETIKTKLVDDQRKATPRFQGTVHGTLTIIREEGIGGIYRGLFPVIVRQGANAGVKFWSYSALKSLVYGNSRPGETLPTGVTLGIGALSGAATVLATQPLDVVKTRMQSLEARTLYRNSFHCSARIFSEEGFMQFWRGTTPRMGRFIISTPIVFTVYEKVIALTGARSSL